jgi:hypothetical protein
MVETRKYDDEWMQRKRRQHVHDTKRNQLVRSVASILSYDDDRMHTYTHTRTYENEHWSGI